MFLFIRGKYKRLFPLFISHNSVVYELLHKVKTKESRIKMPIR